MKTHFTRPIGLAVMSALLLAAGRAQSPSLNDTVMRAMRDELSRSMAQLQMESLAKPYFISYHVQERRAQGTTAEFGATLSRYETRTRRLIVQVRVGSPALDNTNFRDLQSILGQAITPPLALDDDYAVLRREIWLATDRAYKSAVEQLSHKKAALENRTRTDETPDFSPQSAATTTDVSPGAPIDLNAAEALVRELSAMFREMPDVQNSDVHIGADNESTWYVNSEGSAFVREFGTVDVTATAATQASDGGPITDHYEVYRRRWEDLPTKAQLAAAIRSLGDEVTHQRGAVMIEPYNGPVLFEGEAAATLFAQAFATHLVGRKTQIVDSSLPAPFQVGQAENPFVDKLGARVLPDFLSVTDDPTLTQIAGVPLVGSMKVDDEGVPTVPVKLVEKGRLKTLLVSRSPVRGVPASTGSFHGDTPLPTNLVVASSDGVDDAALKAELIKSVQQRGKAYGVIVRRLASTLRTEQAAMAAASRSGGAIERAIVAVKVFPDGHEEPLRNVQVAGLDAAAFKDILATGIDPHVTLVPFRLGLGGAESSVIAVAVPSLLFEDVTLKKPAGQLIKPPLLKHPFFDKS